MTDLKAKYGPVALITGASSGIGEAFARELARRGLDLILVARRGEILRRLAETLEQRHAVRTLVVEQDLAEPDAGAAVQRQVEAAGWSVDFLINNAGFGLYEQFGTGEMASDLKMVDLHCRAVIDLTWRFLPAMKRRRRGAVIIISSVLGVMPAPYLATYAATKAFDLSLGESLHGELKSYGIDALAVLPTLTETNFHAGANLKRTPLLTRQATDVVRTTLEALGRRPSVADGALTRLLIVLMKFIPRSLLLAAYLRFRPRPAG